MQKVIVTLSVRGLSILRPLSIRWIVLRIRKPMKCFLSIKGGIKMPSIYYTYFHNSLSVGQFLLAIGIGLIISLIIFVFLSKRLDK